MMDKITKVFDRQNDDQVNELLQTFYALSYDKSHDMATNISAVQNIAFRLNALQQKITDEMMISKILAILPPEYATFRTAWGSVAKAERTLDNLMTRLFSEESNVGKNSNSGNVAFKTSAKNNGSNKTIPLCYTCNNPGHFKNSNLYPLKKFDSNGTEQKCKYCKKFNHKSEKCFFSC